MPDPYGIAAIIHELGPHTPFALGASVFIWAVNRMANAIEHKSSENSQALGDIKVGVTETSKNIGDIKAGVTELKAVKCPFFPQPVYPPYPFPYPPPPPAIKDA